MGSEQNHTSDDSFSDDNDATKEGAGVGKSKDSDYEAGRKYIDSFTDTMYAEQRLEPGEAPLTIWGFEKDGGGWFDLTDKPDMLILGNFSLEVRQETQRLLPELGTLAEFVKANGSKSEYSTSYKFTTHDPANGYEVRLYANTNSDGIINGITIWHEGGIQDDKAMLARDFPNNINLTPHSMAVQFSEDNFRLPINDQRNPRNWNQHKLQQYLGDYIFPLLGIEVDISKIDSPDIDLERPAKPPEIRPDVYSAIYRLLVTAMENDTLELKFSKSKLSARSTHVLATGSISERYGSAEDYSFSHMDASTRLGFEFDNKGALIDPLVTSPEDKVHYGFGDMTHAGSYSGMPEDEQSLQQHQELRLLFAQKYLKEMQKTLKDKGSSQ